MAAAALAVRGGDESSACEDPLPKGGEAVTLRPDDFTVEIDNPYWPMAEGSRWVYRVTDRESEQEIVVTVTAETRVVDGIEARVVHEVATEDGERLEVTDDWYAQDSCGNVWYLGEATTEFENGEPTSAAGSWEAGIDGAQAGILIPADPVPGLGYRQEHYEGEAEDAAVVLSVHEQAEVPFGHFTDALLTKDVTPLEPKVLEYKLYAKGVGPVLVVGVSGGAAREELVRFTRGG